MFSDIYEIKLNQWVDFEKGPTLTFSIEQLDPSILARLKIYWYNENKQRWEYVGGTYDSEKQQVFADLPHFSKYALIYNPEQRLFSDLTGRWSEHIVYRLSSIGVIDGFMRENRWVFAPQTQINRQEFIKLLVTAADRQVGTQVWDEAYMDGEDVSSWAVPYVAAALEEGWLKGVARNGDIWLEPTRSITRAEAAVMMARMLDESSEIDQGKDVFIKDRKDIPVWAVEDVERLYEAGLLSGYPDQTFRPNQMITREEAAVLVMNLLDWQYANEIAGLE